VLFDGTDACHARGASVSDNHFRVHINAVPTGIEPADPRPAQLSIASVLSGAQLRATIAGWATLRAHAWRKSTHGQELECS
jgi:hypothetical protein